MEWIKNEKNCLKELIFMMPFLFGLYYEFTAYIAGLLVSFLLIYVIWKNKKVVYSKQWGFAALVFSYLFYLLSLIYAVDKGMAFAGFLKVLPVVLFLFLLLQYEKEDIKDCFISIPYSGLAMLILSASTYFIPQLTEYFYNNGRLGGFFQYSNTFALFLLSGIIILGSQKKKTWVTAVGMVVLVLGILLTGSRTVFVLCAFNFIYLFIKNKKMRKPMFIMGMLLLIFVFLIVGISGSFDNMGRFLTINLQESTFVGRLLYDKDGLRLLLQHPMGLGYLGAYYLQPSFQTGVYTVRFLHNDWLQFAVDAGIIGALLHFAGLFSGIKKSDTVQKQLFITLFIGSLFDFNMQFMIMPMVLMMTLSFDKRCEVKKPVKRSAISTLLKLGCLGFIYFMVAFGSVYFDHYTLATKMYVGNTEAKITLLQLAENKEALNQSANAVISQNKHIALAYDAKAMISQADHHYDSMLFFKEKAIENKKYDIKEYESYLQMLSTAIEAENAVGNRVKVEEYATKVFEIPEMLKKVKAQTDPLAYKINDKPALELSEESVAYIEALRKVLKR